jgi:nicotinamide-nucleotide amidase
MQNPQLQDLAERLIGLYKKAGLRLATAESCTGGMVAAALTDIPGASAVFERGFVTYSNDAKIDLLGVLPESLAAFGAVSAEVAEAMAEGALAYSLADIALSITGIAGPDGGSALKPVGTVYIGLARKEGARFHYQCAFDGDRDDIRRQAAAEALRLAILLAEGEEG